MEFTIDLIPGTEPISLPKDCVADPKGAAVVRQVEQVPVLA